MIIKDELITPFQIKVTDVSYNVIENRVSENRVSEKGKDTLITHGYYTDMKQALRKIVKLKAKEDVKTMDLNSYFNRIEDLSNKLEKFK